MCRPASARRRASMASGGRCSEPLRTAGERTSVEGEQFLRLLDAAQGVAADRDQARAGAERGGEGGGDQHLLVDRSAHGGDAAGLVDRRTDDGEVEAVRAADVAE